VPKPFVDALAVWSFFDQVALLGAPFGSVLKLLLESCELCKRRIWIRFLVLPGAETGLRVILIALGAVDRRAAITTARAVVPLVALIALLLPFLTLLAIVPALPIGMLLCAIAPLLALNRLLFSGRFGGGRRGLIGRRGSLLGRLRDLPAVPLRARPSRMMRLALGPAGRTPDLDHFRFGRRSRRCGFGRRDWRNYRLDDCGGLFIRLLRWRLRRRRRHNGRNGARKEIRLRQQRTRTRHANRIDCRRLCNCFDCCRLHG
jgi:hypothetical protein